MNNIFPLACRWHGALRFALLAVILVGSSAAVAQSEKSAEALKAELNAATEAGDLERAAVLKEEIKQAEARETAARIREEDKQILIFQRNYEAVLAMENSTTEAKTPATKPNPVAKAGSLLDKVATKMTNAIAPEESAPAAATSAPVGETAAPESERVPAPAASSRDLPRVSILGGRMTVNAVLTPNGDGVNDFLVFSDLETISPKNLLEITSPKGESIYNMSNYKNDWNGTSSLWLTMTTFPPGQYTYTLKLKGSTKETLTGTFEIIR